VLLLVVPTVALLVLALFQDRVPPVHTGRGVPMASSGECSDWPTQSWCTSTPEEQGMDPLMLDRMMQFVDEHNMTIDSVLVVRHGKIVFEEYRNGYDSQRKHHLQSVTKSFSSMLIGIAIHEGLIESVDQRMVDLFPEHTIANMNARKHSITLENLLTMSDGMDWHELDYPYTDSRNTLGQMWNSRDAVEHVLNRPMESDPGQAWAYNSGTSILLGGIIEQVAGRDVQSFAREYLFDPIGVGPVFWDKTTGNHYHTDGGLYMTPRDMARFGYLMLHNGTWDGREIVSAEWVARSSTAHYQTNGGYGYGYQWWIFPDGIGYAARGHYEQIIFVLPEADLVVVFTANIPDNDPYRADGLLHRFILPACIDLPEEAVSQTYAKYGFTLEYPRGYSVIETPIAGRDTVSDASGLVQFQSFWFPPDLINVVWDVPEVGADPEVYLEEFFASISQDSGLEVTKGTSTGARKGDHEVLVQSFDLTEGKLALAAATGVWHCKESGRVYILTYATEPETDSQDVQTRFQQYLDAFVCHE
ncbi:MAG TPA: serine hydrolase, partial [Anaerolineae bacterium]|nr:serine hydrolase [Anaerolineae bacterium]